VDLVADVPRDQRDAVLQAREPDVGRVPGQREPPPLASGVVEADLVGDLEGRVPDVDAVACSCPEAVAPTSGIPPAISGAACAGADASSSTPMMRVRNPLRMVSRSV
jgi:hypothetical protein